MSPRRATFMSQSPNVTAPSADGFTSKRASGFYNTKQPRHTLEPNQTEYLSLLRAQSRVGDLSFELPDAVRNRKHRSSSCPRPPRMSEIILEKAVAATVRPQSYLEFHSENPAVAKILANTRTMVESKESPRIMWSMGTVIAMVTVLLCHAKGFMDLKETLYFELALMIFHLPAVLPNSIFNPVQGAVTGVLQSFAEAASRSWWVYWIAYLIPGSAVVGHYTGYPFLTAFFTFVTIPFMDLFCGKDHYNPTTEESISLMRERSYHWAILFWVPMQVAFLCWGVYVAATQELTMLEFVGLALSVGISNTEGLIISHELFHKHNAWEQNLGKVILLTVSYMHFYIEHLKGHHVNVGTPLDPAQAKLGSDFYSYLPQTVIGGYKSAWGIEKKRLTRKGCSTWSWRNQMIWFITLPFVVAYAFHCALGFKAAFFFLFQSCVAVVVLELTNYLEHYGLDRKELSPGVYERVNGWHSWDADDRLSNFFLFKLQRHADHHWHASRRYQTLRNFEQSPKLPTGYFGMLVLALFPPLFHRVMDWRVVQAQEEMAYYRDLNVMKVTTSMDLEH